MRFWTMLAALVAATPAAAQEVPAPEWLAGQWCTEEGSRGRTCESWTPFEGGMMLGTGQTVRLGRTTSWEFMRVAVEGGVPVFYGSPAGSPAIAFRGEAMPGARAIAFVNSGNDFPKRVTYAREGNVLVATISGSDPAKDSVTWRYQRVGD